MKKILVCMITIALLLTGCTTKEEVVDLQSKEAIQQQTLFEEYLTKEFTDYLSSSKLGAHFSVEDLSVYGLEDMEVSLGDVESYDFDAVRQSVQELKGIDRKYLTDDQKSYYDRYLTMLERNLEYEGLEDYQFLFSVNSGINANLITLFTEYVLRSEEDIQDLIVYLKETDDYLQQCLDYTQKQVDKGIVQSDVAIDGILDSCERFLSANENEITRIVCKRIDEFESLTNEKKTAYKKQVMDAVNTSVIPGYQKVVQYFKDLKGTAKNNGAYANWEDGKKYYEVLLKDKSSSNMSVKEIKNKLASAIDDGIEEMIDIVQKHPEALDEMTEVSFDGDAHVILNHLKGRIQENYPLAADVNYIVDYLDPSIAGDYVVAYYLIPPVDNYKENVIRVNPSCTDLFATLAHEGYPGHLYQTTYFLQHNYHPIANALNYIGYSEGWAVYVEMDAYHMMDTQLSDEAIRLLQLNTYLSHYLVCYADIMVHYDGADQEEVVDFMYQYGLDGAYIYDVVLEEAGTYIPYGVGYLQMSALQKKVEKALKDNYDPKEFHEVILNAGDCSFEYLEKQVNQYLANQ